MASRDWNDMALVSEDKSCLLKQTKIVFWWNLSFDESCPVMEVVFWWKLSRDGSCLLMKVVQWWKLSYDERYNSQRSDESCLLMSVRYWWKLYIDEVCLLMKVVFLMKVVYWWELSIDESYLLMNVVYWWKLSSDGSCLLMKVIIVKEVISCDVSPVAMFFFNPQMLSFPNMYNTMGSKMDGLAVREHFLPKKGTIKIFVTSILDFCIRLPFFAPYCLFPF